MEENIYVIIGLIVSLIVIFYPTARAKGAKNKTVKSELHVRDRYAVADLIREEWEERQR